MKNLYPNSKGKIHPKPSASLDPSAPSVLKLLPSTILALVSLLSPEDSEVVAYLIFHSFKTNRPLSVHSPHSSKRCKKPPLFECSCFDCYTSFWTRWDSSPNRDLIHQAIEAFEEHLPTSSSTSKKRRKNQRRGGAAAKSPPQVGELDFSEAAGSGNRPEPDSGNVSPKLEAVASVPVSPPESGGRVSARRSWADVMSLFNSRLWSLWNPGAGKGE